MLSLITALLLTGPASAGIDEAWSLSDPNLAAVLEAALQDNPDVHTARSRALAAQRMAEQSVAARLPGASVDLSASMAPSESLGFQFGGLPGGADMPERYGSGSALLSVSYEVDLWGRHWLSHRASRHEAAAARGDQRATELSVAHMAASSWLDAVTANQRTVLVQEQIQLSADLLELVELRQQRGEATALDVLQQRQQLATAQALLPRVQLLSKTSRYGLAALVGQQPTAELSLSATLPQPSSAPPSLEQASLDTQRPDVQAATDRAAGATDSRRAALRTVLPSVRVQGQAGWQGLYMDELDVQDTWGAGASLSVPLFNGGAAYSAYRASQAQEQVALSSLESARLAAWREAAGAEAGVQAATAELVAIQAQEEAARLAFDEARERYLRGVSPYLTVTTALSSWQRAQLDALEAHRAVLSARIQLNDALAVQVLD